MRRNDRNYLFHKGGLAASLDAGLRSVSEFVERIPRGQFLATSIDTLVENIEEQLFVDPLVLYEDQMQMEHGETKIDVSGRFDYGNFDGGPMMTDGHLLRFFIPFSGAPRLWPMRPNVWSSMIPQGEIDERRKVLTLSFKNTSNTAPDWYKRELESSLQLIR